MVFGQQWEQRAAGVLRCTAKLACANRRPAPPSIPSVAWRLCSAFDSICLCCAPHWPQVDAELSVPAVTALLLSSAALALSATADQLMSGGLTRTAHEVLVAAGPLGTGGWAGAWMLGGNGCTLL